MDDETHGLLDGLVFTAQLNLADVPSGFLRVPLNTPTDGAHLALRHEVTKRLAQHPEQFRHLSAAELRRLDDYFVFADHFGDWNPHPIERRQPAVLRRILRSLKAVDHAWYLSLFEGHCGVSGCHGSYDLCSAGGDCGLGLTP